MDILKGALGGISSFSDVGVAIMAFFVEITDFRLWRSLGWLLLGLVMMAAGAVAWLKT